MAASAADSASDIPLDLSAAGNSFTQGDGERDDRHPAWKLAGLFAGAGQLPRRIILLSAATGVLDLAFPLVLLLTLERAGDNRTLYIILTLVAGLFCAVAAVTHLRRVRNRLLADFTASETFEFQMRAAHHLLNTTGAGTVRISPSAASDAFRAIDEWGRYSGSLARLTALELPFIALYLVAIGVIGGVLVAVPTILAALFVVWMSKSRAAMKPLALEVAEHDRKRFDFYAESIEALTTVKALAIEPRLQRRHESYLRGAVAADEEAILLKMRTHDFGNLFEMVMFFPVAAAGCVMVAEGVLSIGAVASCSLIAILVARSARRIVSGTEQTEAAEMALDRAQAFLEPQERAVDRAAPTGPVKVQFNGVSMDGSGAPDSGRGVNLTIRPGETIGIIIRDENRHRMLTDLLRGRIEPDHGECLIDGRKASAQPVALPRVMLVDDEPAIFRGTIMENISMFGAMNPATASEMARRIEVEPEILRLPDGYHTMLTGDGTPYPARDMLLAITLVRAAAIRPGLLILDLDRSMLAGIAARACEKMIGELRGSVTIVALGRTLMDAVSDGRSYRMQGWSLAPVDTVTDTDDSPDELEAAQDG
jgi:ATP-binding cassette subfamily C protein LapB